MESASNTLHLNPARSGFRKSVQGKRAGKALVVGASDGRINLKSDPNVITWPQITATSDPVIPEGVTHLWVSDYVSGWLKQRLYYQARKRRIKVWKCCLVILHDKLKPFWSYSWNCFTTTSSESNDHESDELKDERGGLTLFGDEGDTPAHVLGDIDEVATKTGLEETEIEPEAEDRTGEDDNAIPKLSVKSRSRKPTTKDKALAARLELMKSVHRKRPGTPVPQPEAAVLKPGVKAEKPAPVAKTKPGNGKLSFGGLGFEEVVSGLLEVEKPPKVVKVSSRATLLKGLRAELQSCSMIDREVFLYHTKYCSCISMPNGSGHSSVSVTETAREFGMGESKVRDSLERVWGKLPHSRLVHEDGSLEVRSNSVARD